MFAVRRGDWKAIWDEAGPEQLFHLASDPGETHNLAEQHPELLRDLLDGQPRHSLRSSAPADLGEEQRAMLQALGYVEAGD
jgi:arylsulfatase